MAGAAVGGAAGNGGAGGTGGSAGGAAGTAGGGGGSACGSAGGGAGAGAYPRAGWTAAYTCTGTCLAGNGDSPNDKPELAFDGDYKTRWSTNRYEQDFWNAMPRLFPLYFTVDMKEARKVSKVTMHASCRDIFDTPGMLDVLVSTDGTTFTPVVMDHKPAVPPNGETCPPKDNAVATDTITFTATCARYIQIKATQSLVAAHPGSGDRYWAIGEFNAFP